MSISSYFEDPKHPSMGPIRRYLRMFLIYSDSRTKIQATIFYLFYVLIVVLNINQIVYLVMSRRAEACLKYAQYLLLHVGPLKIMGYVLNQSQWQTIIQRISEIDCELMQDEISRNHTEKYVKYNRRVMLIFWSVVCLMNFLVTLEIWFNFLSDTVERDDVNDGSLFYFWWPFGYSRLSAYVVLVLKNLYIEVNSVYVVGWHSGVLAIMIFFSGQLDVVRVRFLHALDSKDETEQRGNLIKCHKHYFFILEMHKLCNALVSPIMCINLLIISGNLSVMAIYSRVDMAATLQSLLAILMMLFLVHWHGSEVFFQSQKVSSGVFESAWLDKSRVIKRDVLLLCGATRHELVLTAGPLHEISLPTFVALMRFSYSFYTLMSETAKI